MTTIEELERRKHECMQPEYTGPDNYKRIVRDAIALCRTLQQQLAELEEKRVMQLAGISTASFGYWKEGDTIHPDYDTVALRDVAKLYAKYDEKYQQLADRERDALRYRWLREHPYMLIESDHPLGPRKWRINSALDIAVDAALAQSAKGESPND